MNKLLLLLFLFIPQVFISCKKYQKTVKLEHIVKEWTNKTILFPNIASTYIDDKDSLKNVSISNMDTKNYKILLYIDSTGCTSCKLRLHVWKTYIEQFVSKVNFMFYFQPKR
jgi:hypothetical protein